MLIYIICVILLNTLSSYCASDKPTNRTWAKVVTEGKVIRKQSTQPQPIEASSSQPILPILAQTATPVDPAVDPNGFVQKILEEHKTGSAIFSASLPLLRSQAHPFYKSALCHTNAQMYQQEHNTTGELICLCNELAWSFNDHLVSVNNLQVFPEYNLDAVQRLCSLFVGKHKQIFEEIYGDDPAKEVFLETLYRSGLFAQMPHAVHLLARSSERTGNFARAVFFYDQLPATYTQHIQREVAVARILHARETDTTKLAPIFEEIVGDQTICEQVITALTEQQQTQAVKDIWTHVYQKGKAEDKPRAAFELYKLLRDTDPRLAEIHLVVAASKGYLDACKEVYEIAMKEDDPKTSIKLMETAAQGNYRPALEKAGTYYKTLSAKQTDPEKIASLDKAYSYFERALKQKSAHARLEMAIIPDRDGRAKPADMLIANLDNFIKSESSTGLRAEALYNKGKLYRLKADVEAKQPNGKKLHDQYMGQALTALKTSADMGHEEALIEYPSALVQMALCTKTPKEKQNLLDLAEKRFNRELGSPTNRPLALVGLSRVDLARNKFSESKMHITQAYSIAPDDIDILKHTLTNFKILLGKKQFNHMKTMARSMLEINPHCAEAHFYLGICEEQAKNKEVAVSHFTRAGELGLASGYIYLGKMFRNNAQGSDDHQSALTAFEQALCIDPKNLDLLTLIGQTYHDLGQHVQARSAYTKATAGLNPDALKMLALYWHRGLGGPASIQLAADFYTSAATQYAAIRNINQNIFCTKMGYMLRHQHPGFLSGLTESEYIKIVRKTIEEITKLTRDSSIQIVNEAFYTLALVYQHLAGQYQDAEKKRDTYFLALDTLDEMPDKSHIESSFLSAEIIRVLIFKKLLLPNDSKSLTLIKNLSPLYEGIIFNLEQKRPLHQMLIEAYNSYALHLKQSVGDVEKALSLFRKAAERSSIEAMLHLHCHYKQINMPEESHAWLEKAQTLDPKSSAVQNFFARIQVKAEASSSSRTPEMVHEESVDSASI